MNRNETNKKPLSPRVFIPEICTMFWESTYPQECVDKKINEGLVIVAYTQGGDEEEL